MASQLIAASCVACCQFTSRALDTQSGPMCRDCRRFMKAPLEDLAPDGRRLEPTKVSTPDGWREYTPAPVAA